MGRRRSATCPTRASNATGVAGGRAFRNAVNHEETAAGVLALAERLFRGEAEGRRASDVLASPASPRT